MSGRPIRGFVSAAENIYPHYTGLGLTSLLITKLALIKSKQTAVILSIPRHPRLWVDAISIDCVPCTSRVCLCSVQFWEHLVKIVLKAIWLELNPERFIFILLLTSIFWWIRVVIYTPLPKMWKEKQTLGREFKKESYPNAWQNQPGSWLTKAVTRQYHGVFMSYGTWDVQPGIILDTRKFASYVNSVVAVVALYVIKITSIAFRQKLRAGEKS